MIMKRLNYILIVLIVLLTTTVFSQDKAIKVGDESFKSLQYQEAIKSYSKAWVKFKNETYKKKRVAKKLADCYRLTNNPKEASNWYAKIVDSKLAKKQPMIYYYYAEALRATGNCDQATKYYQQFLIERPGDLLGENGLLSCQYFTNPDKNTRYKIVNVETLNSENDDYAVAYSSKKLNQLFFTSNRKGSMGKDRENWTGAWFSDIYLSSENNNNWSAPVSADNTGLVNTEANEGTVVFNKKFTAIYFTRCDKGAEKKVFCQILQSARHGNRWSKPKVVMSDKYVNCGQPAVSDDELTLWFVSERKEGIGGKDVWVAYRDRKSKPFGTPINCGTAINTPGDEMFPVIQGDTILYFSSNGHPGYGGLDLFKSIKNDTIWNKPQNIQAPFNSQGDDFSIIFKNDKEGFFSSNRKGGMGGDDIYSFEKMNIYFKLDGIIKDERTLFTLTNVIVKLYQDGSSIGSIKTNEKGFYVFDSTYFKEDKNYSIVFSKENYFSVSIELKSSGFTENHVFRTDVLLKPIPETPIVLPDILYDLGKWDLKQQYQDSLMILVKILEDNPGLVIELGSHTDSRASLEFNDDLSQKRAQSVVDFLISQGIHPDRLIAKGYGERVPRKLEKTVKTNGYTLQSGTVLNEQFVNLLSSNRKKEAAHELNRRTEFKIVSKDFNPTVYTGESALVVELINDTLEGVVPFFITSDNFRMIDCYVNGTIVKAVVDINNTVSAISEQKVIDLMKQGVLSKNNFGHNAEDILQNNRVKDGALITINEIIIGSRSLKDVQFTVKQNVLHSLTIGKNTLNRFGEFKIDDVVKQIKFR